MPNFVRENEATSTVCTRVLGWHVGWAIVAIVALFVLVYFYITVSSYFCNRRYTEARILALQEIMGRDTFENSMEVNAFSPNYAREIRLFKSLNHDEQHKYLHMSRDEKFAYYGRLLSHGSL